jgi:uncharacterized protein (TIRG00374 family)
MILEAAKRQPRRLPWRLTLQATVSVALLVWLAKSVEPEALAVVLTVPPVVLTAAVMLFASAHLWSAVRLHVLLGAARVGVWRLFCLVLLGNFASNFLPGSVGGDVVKGIALVRQGVDSRKTLMTLLLDRVLNTLALLVLAAVTIPASGLWRFLPEHGVMVLIGLSLCGLLVLGASYRARYILAGRLRPVAKRLGARVTRLLEGVRESVDRWAAAPRSVLTAGLLSLAVVLSSVAAQWLLCQYRGANVTFTSLTAIVCLLTLALLVPISFNGIGVQEIGYVYMLNLLGIDTSTAVAVAILSRLLILGTSLPGALVLCFGTRSVGSGKS